MTEYETLIWIVIGVMTVIALLFMAIEKIVNSETSLQKRLKQVNKEADALLEQARKEAKNSPSLGETKWGGL